MNRHFGEPYQFVPPYRSRFWVRLAVPLAPLLRRIGFGVRRFQAKGVGHLHESLGRKAGVLLAPNHWCLADGLVVGSLAAQAGAVCHYLVAAHTLKNGRFRAWLIHRLGAFSILREGSDREAIRASVRILAEGRRPLAVFAEGTWYRQNERLGPLQRGAALMARMAARTANRPIVIHPVAIRYWLLADPRPALRQRLDAIERHLGCLRSSHCGLVARLEAVTAVWLSAQERAHIGREQPGTLDQRRLGLLTELLARLDARYFGEPFTDHPMDRVRRLRGACVRAMTDGGPAEEPSAEAKDLDTLLLCEHLYSHSLRTVLEQPSWDRLAESVLRMAEIVWDDFEAPVAPMGVVIEAGPAIDVSADRGRPDDSSADDLTNIVAGRIQEHLDSLSAKGPPAAWRVSEAWGDPRAA
jgi:1-acyl-sn-glycerol-3-phosphate acyltransferase